MRRQLATLAAAALVALALPGIVTAADTQAVVGRAIAGHGTLLVAASNQMTVSTCDKDVAGSGVSNCTGGCLANWPALTIPAGNTPTGGAGVTGTLGTIVRADNGATQVTYDGLPLYFFANDAAPGDTTASTPTGGRSCWPQRRRPPPRRRPASPPRPRLRRRPRRPRPRPRPTTALRRRQPHPVAPHLRPRGYRAHGGDPPPRDARS